jgi:hypothetical protein
MPATQEPMSAPSVTLAGAKLPVKPRRRGLLPSTRKVIDAAYSPPIESLCAMRSLTNMVGARVPPAAAVDRQPISRVEIAMAAVEIIKDRPRPWRSAIWPNKTPPSGRMKKAAVKTAKTEQRSNLVGGGREGSNGFGAVPADIILSASLSGSSQWP